MPNESGRVRKFIRKAQAQGGSDCPQSDDEGRGQRLGDKAFHLGHASQVHLTKGEATQEFDGPMTTELKIFQNVQSWELEKEVGTQTELMLGANQSRSFSGASNRRDVITNPLVWMSSIVERR